MRLMRTRPGAWSRASTAIATIALPFAPRAAGAGAPGANVALLDLDGAREYFAAGEHHRSAQLVQPHPRGLIATQPKDALQAQR
jgi:hypothetical protein